MSELMQAVQELKESTSAHQAALNELEAVMLARGFITRESLARARAEILAEQAYV